MQPTPQHLASLFKQTHEMLRLYYNKSQWPSIYPLLSKQAEQFYKLYETHPNALQAQLCLYVSDFGYTTNLVVNQCVVVAALCKSLNYNSQVSQQLIAVCLTNYLCVQTQTNKLAAQQPLNNEEKKQWQARHQLAVKLLQSANLPSNDIARILAPLNKYKQALLSAPKIMIYDGATTLVALANIIAMNITYRAADDHVNLYKAISDIYIRTPNSFAQNALKKLVANIGPYLPGSLVSVAEQQLTYVCSKTHNTGRSGHMSSTCKTFRDFGLKVCQHTLAVANFLNMRSEYEEFVKAKIASTTVTDLIDSQVSASAGRKQFGRPSCHRLS